MVRDAMSKDPVTLTLTMVSPMRMDFTVSACTTLNQLLDLASEKLGLQERHFEHVQLGWKNQIQTRLELSVLAAGMADDPTFTVLGFEDARDFARQDAKKVRLFAKHLTSVGAQGPDIQLVLKFAPERIHETDPDGFTPLHYAAMTNQPKTTKELLAGGAVVDAKAKDRSTPLHVAAKYNSLQCAGLLLQAKASLQALNKGRRTPLQEALISQATPRHHHDNDGSERPVYGPHGSSDDAAAKAHSALPALLVKHGAR
eukprot:TRINITY_DN16626_c0_g1_i3.p1 TRINITY_DN16626_c0_g1~~TRINITY_DN16626_c0_g1_i3.p1  ORF type:complete len:257 (+),score=61.32 TRINITY_DN16626_c0_g1_i3:230-1000(+)